MKHERAYSKMTSAAARGRDGIVGAANFATRERWDPSP
jgi:hypothetical protein